MIESNPVQGVKRYPDKKNERFLSAEELGSLGRGLREAETQGVNAKVLNIIKLLVFTGARRGEIEGLQWSEVDLQGRRLKLADLKTGQKAMPLNSAALDLLSVLQEQATPGPASCFRPLKETGTILGHLVSGPLCVGASAWRMSAFTI